jgi:hypothetical protein
VWELIRDAYLREAWKPLGYGSWDMYCAAEFGTARLRVPREERAEVVGSLRDAGLSLRAIAAATGLGRGTVERELEGVPFGTGETKVTGLDGKTYAGQAEPPVASGAWAAPPFRLHSVPKPGLAPLAPRGEVLDRVGSQLRQEWSVLKGRYDNRADFWEVVGADVDLQRERKGKGVFHGEA